MSLLSQKLNVFLFLFCPFSVSVVTISICLRPIAFLSSDQIEPRLPETDMFLFGLASTQEVSNFSITTSDGGKQKVLCCILYLLERLLLCPRTVTYISITNYYLILMSLVNDKIVFCEEVRNGNDNEIY